MKKVDQHLTRYPQKMPDHRRLCFGVEIASASPAAVLNSTT
jgi:hypothetical protein